MDKLALVNIGQTFGSPFGQTKGIGDFITTLMAGGLVLAGLILLFLLVGGGFMMISSAGGNDPKGAAQGKQAITYALVGFLVVFCAYWIIAIIQRLVGVEFFTAPGFIRGSQSGV